jgi:hypothetical protein
MLTDTVGLSLHSYQNLKPTGSLPSINHFARQGSALMMRCESLMMRCEYLKMLCESLIMRCDSLTMRCESLLMRRESTTVGRAPSPGYTANTLKTYWACPEVEGLVRTKCTNHVGRKLQMAAMSQLCGGVPRRAQGRDVQRPPLLQHRRVLVVEGRVGRI